MVRLRTIAPALIAGFPINPIASGQVAGHWRFESFSGPNAPDDGPSDLESIHNGLGSVGSDVAVDMVPLLDLPNTDAFRTQSQNA